METEYVDVKEVKDLYCKLLSWDKEKFLCEIGLGRYLSNGELREIVNKTIV